MRLRQHNRRWGANNYVGGYYEEADGTPRLPSQQFLGRHDLVVLDVVPCNLPGYVQGDGTNLTYPDNSFDLVISCDTLEHIPPGLRERFIREAVRVARYGLLLICPFDDYRVILAEQVLFAYIQAELRAVHDQLQEHRDNGLPHLPFVVQILEHAGCV
jgi:ubiquinone/menaquinone biosynthesis C-methylase UbiE